MLPLSVQVPASVVLLAGGLMACFGGYRLFRFVLGVYGFIVGGLIGLTLEGTGGLSPTEVSQAITFADEVSETHRMRYLFLPEIEYLLGGSGFEIVQAQQWMTGHPLSDATWYACIAARATRV